MQRIIGLQEARAKCARRFFFPDNSGSAATFLGLCPSHGLLLPNPVREGLPTTRQLSAWQRGTSFILLRRIPRQCSQVIRSNV
jgi:hypothetical protein